MDLHIIEVDNIWLQFPCSNHNKPFLIILLILEANAGKYEQVVMLFTSNAFLEYADKKRGLNVSGPNILKPCVRDVSHRI